jgi:uncharacterized protein YeaO (DUF488 family)
MVQPAKPGWVGLKRAYEKPAPRDGHRVLVDRLWPRGVSKDTLGLDEWLQDLAPTDELRKWFAHEPERWPEFQRRYRRELNSEFARLLIGHLVEELDRGPLTLVYAAHDEKRNNAVVLKAVLDRRAHRRAPRRRRPPNATLRAHT